MDQPTDRLLGEWLPITQRARVDHRLDEPRHLHVSPLAARAAAAWPISEGVLASLQRSASLSHNAAWGYAYGQSDRLIQLARRVAGERLNVLAPAEAVERVLVQVLDGELSDAARRAVIATLAQHLPRIVDRSLPRSILELYPRALARLADFLETGGLYDQDLFGKDIRFVSGASVDVGAQFLDVLVSSSAMAQAARLRRSAGFIGRLVRVGELGRAFDLMAGGEGDWLQIHTDIRNVADFNPDGWDRCYSRIADLLAGRPHIAGMLGISWFYDPQLCEISPRLSYLQHRPLQNGAFRVRLKASALDAQRAGAVSPTRRRLIEAGAYRPVCYALFWPRRELLRWAHRIEREDFVPSSTRISDVA